MRAIGVTRLADVTGLDCVGIPVWAAVRPSASEASISVQNGKGPTRMHAKAGAMMEAIEHYCCEKPAQQPQYGSYRSLRRRVNVVSPQSLILHIESGYTENLKLEWLEGTDLVSDKQIWVPACAVLKPHPRDRTTHIFRGSTNGLASGNTIEEAVCHGMAEVIERDSWTLAIIQGMLQPRIRKLAAAVRNGAPCEPAAIRETTPEGQLFPIIDLNSLPEPAFDLAERFKAAGIRLVIREITSDLGIPTFVAAAWDTPATGPVHFHSGFGAHPDARVAVTRAITELAQSRLTIFQGVREDIDKVAKLDGTVDKPAQSLWLADGPTKSFQFVPTYRNNDILDDINVMLDRLQAAGLKQVIVVNLTKTAVGFPVLKVLVPGLEHWSARHFDPDWMILGSRARKYLI
jgi:ribosomal protein S12 methylthiotransferase accessory factor